MGGLGKRVAEVLRGPIQPTLLFLLVVIALILWSIGGKELVATEIAQAVEGVLLAIAAVTFFSLIERAWIRRHDQEELKKIIETQTAQLKTHLEGFSVSGTNHSNTAEILNSLKAELQSLTERIRSALESTRHLHGTKSLMLERESHYPKEKEFLGEKFVPLLMERCHYIASKQDDAEILLIIDSGSTVLPAVRHICRKVKAWRNQPWIHERRLTICTTSLEAASQILEKTKESANRNAELIIDVYMLPGKALPQFAGVVGDSISVGIESVKEIIKEKSKKRRQSSSEPTLTTIALLTGNWFQATVEWGPVPLARGEGHGPAKAAAIKHANEIYLISPLGKIFWRNDICTINYEMEEISRDVHENYDPVEIPVGFNSKIKLVTTLRPSDADRQFLLATLSGKLRDDLKVTLVGSTLVGSQVNMHDFKEREIIQIPHLGFEFDDVARELPAQVRDEFPHVETRVQDFLIKCFWVPRKLAELACPSARHHTHPSVEE